MENDDINFIELIKNKKIIHPKTKTIIPFSDLYSTLERDQLVYVTFFRVWGCIFCRARALELNKISEKLEQDYPRMIKYIGVGLEEKNLDDFVKRGFFKHEIYLDVKKGIYNALKFKKPGCFSCFGFCTKNFFKRIKEIDQKFKDPKIKNEVQLKNNLFQMGGSILITPRGEVIFMQQDSFYGDNVKEEVLREVVINYYNTLEINESAQKLKLI